MQNTGIFQYNSKAVLPKAKVCWDYYCFGSVKPGRNYTSNNGYRFGFNGKEKDGESFEGCIAFEARVFDSRIGKFLSTDPMKSSYPWQTPFAYYANSPISQLDILGMGGPYQEETELKTANSSNEGNSSGKQGKSFSDLIILPPAAEPPKYTVAEWKSANKVTRSGKSKSEFKEAKKEYKNKLQELKDKWDEYDTKVEYRSQLSSAVRSIEISTNPAYTDIRKKVEEANIPIPLNWGDIDDETHIGRFSYDADLAEGKINFCSILIDIKKLSNNQFRTDASKAYDANLAFPNTITYASTISVLVHEIGGHFIFTLMKVSQHIKPDYQASEDFAQKIEIEAYLNQDGRR